jgi:hypothetical protein
MHLKYKIAVIVTWFGKLPSYFPAWLRSAEMNSNIDFFLFFDQDISSEAPNIHFIKTSMEKEIERIALATGEKIEITNSYKFCDLRCFFGLAYQNYLLDYDFWAYCDIDLVFGNIRSFLTDEVLENFDRCYEWGHLSVFRNNDKMNYLYNLPGGIYSKNEIFRGKAKVTPEEHFGINRICLLNNIHWYTKVDFADFWVFYSTLILCHDQVNYEKQTFYWENGRAYRAYIEDGIVKTNEYVYIHWQKRKPTIDGDIFEDNAFFITSKKLIPKKRGIPDIEIIEQMNPNLDIKTKKREKKKYIVVKLKTFIKAPICEKKIWLRQKKMYLKQTGRLLGN